jgi:4-amino-4-deoxy-L-arabinose transferase-like glycosyltransferase
VCGFLFVLPIWSRPLFNKAEVREAVVVLSIVKEGNWLLPMRPEDKIPSKPPFFHWIGALVSLLYGQTTEETVRFPSALFATLGVFLVYVLGRQFLSAEAGFWGAMVLATSLNYQSLGVEARVDMTLCFLVTLSLAFFYYIQSGLVSGRFWWAVFYLALAMSVLTKGPVGIVFVGIVTVIYFAWGRQWQGLAVFCRNPMGLVTLLIVVLWYGLAFDRGGEAFFQKQVIQENLLRFLGFGEAATGHQQPFYFYLPYLFLHGFPWTVFLPFVGWEIVKRQKLNQEPLRFLVLWASVIFLFLSVSAGKRADYLLPLYPPVALLIAHWLTGPPVMSPGIRLGLRVLAGLFVLAASGCLFAVFDFANAQSSSFLNFLASKLKPMDRQSLLWVQSVLVEHRVLTIVFFLVYGLGSVVTARSLWLARFREVRLGLLGLTLLGLTVGQFVYLGAIARGKSYVSFVDETKRALWNGGRLLLCDDDVDHNQIAFYMGGPLSVIGCSRDELVETLRSSSDLVIINERTWMKLEEGNRALPPPLLKSRGMGPEGNARLVLLRGMAMGGGGTAKEDLSQTLSRREAANGSEIVLRAEDAP